MEEDDKVILLTVQLNISQQRLFCNSDKKGFCFVRLLLQHLAAALVSKLSST